MLKNRLIFGFLMTVFFTGVVIVDSWLDGSLSRGAIEKSVAGRQATGLFILVSLIIIAAQFELAKLAERKNLLVLLPVTIPASIMLAGSWYWSQGLDVPLSKYILILLAFSFFAFLLYQYARYGLSSVMANCGISLFSIIYLGLLCSFIIGIRIEFGIWPLLMYVFVVKSADIGAYTIGTLMGRHKFSPVISPGKTWEGMAGAVFCAVIVAFVFSGFFSIMSWKAAAVFGICFAFIGQLGDLVESLIKRDATEKDSANTVPGFGGVLDIVDSPLVAGVCAYLFFGFVR
jgi:phosphatidate cytidylyltransferase